MTLTTRGLGSVVAGLADCPSPLTLVIVATTVAVALKPTEPMPVADALTVLLPAPGPNVRDVLASPLALVVAVAGEIVPPPAVTLKVTTVPACGKPLVPVILTTSGFCSAAPALPVCASPLALVMVGGTSGMNSISRK